MKKTVILLALFTLLSTVAVAQNIQQGVVRTPERYLDGKTIASVNIPGAKIEIEGLSNPVVSDEQGKFSFPVQGNTYRIKKVSSSKYTLLDRKILQKTYTYSPNGVLEILVSNTEADLAYQLKVTEKARDNFKKKAEAKRKENEELKKQNKITEEEYNRRLQELVDFYEKEDQLIRDMVEEILKMDFQSMDKYNKEFNQALIDSDFQKMDSLQQSKGDIIARVNEFLVDNKEIKQRQEQIIKEKEELLKTIEKTRKHLKKELKAWKKEIKHQRKQNEITEEEYERLIQQIETFKAELYK